MYFPWAMRLSVGDAVTLGDAQGYVDYGRWPSWGLVAWCGPWAMPKATLTMAVGQIGGWLCGVVTGRCPCPSPTKPVGQGGRWGVRLMCGVPAFAIQD